MPMIIRLASRGLVALARSSPVSPIEISNHTSSSSNVERLFVAQQQQNRQESSYSSSDKEANDKKKRSLAGVVDDSMYETGAKTRSQTRAAAAASRSGTTWNDSASSLEAQEDGSGDCPRIQGSRSRNAPVQSSVRHDKKSRQFLLDLENNQVARIDYKQIGSNRIDLYHTEVPAELRGKGLGRLLAEGALEEASRANLKLKVTCEYLQHYLNRYADDKHRKLVD